MAILFFPSDFRTPPSRDGDDSIDSLVEDLGLKGGRAKEGDGIAKVDLRIRFEP